MAEASENAVVNAAEYFKQRLEERKPYYAKRVELFEKYKAREDAKVEAAKAEDKKIKVESARRTRGEFTCAADCWHREAAVPQMGTKRSRRVAVRIAPRRAPTSAVAGSQATDCAEPARRPTSPRTVSECAGVGVRRGAVCPCRHFTER